MLYDTCTARIFLSSGEIRVTEPDTSKPYALTSIEYR